jgi:hypothetical protein
MPFIMIFSLLMQTGAIAAVTAGTSCKKAGTKETYKGKTYTCIKLGKKLYWNNGVKVSKYPKSLSVSIYVPAQGRIYWGPLPFTCTNTTDPTYGTILDLGWDKVTLKLFDGAGTLVGVPDTAPKVKLEADGSCSISYQYSNLSLKTGPLVVKTGERTEWNISEVNWSSGFIRISGDSVRFAYGS